MEALLVSRRKRFVILATIFVLMASNSWGVELRPETIAAFEKYIAKVEARLEPRFSGRSFLWSDEFPSAREQLHNGLAVARPVQGNGIVPLQGGLVQDWLGSVFIPHTNLLRVLSVVQDYDHHTEIYKGDITLSKIESHHGDEFLVLMRTVKSKFFLTDVLDIEHRITYTHLDDARVYSRSYSTRINEIASPGRSGEHQLPVGNDRGYLWRMDTYWFFEEREDGVYVACESVTLTREIPFGMGAVLGPIVNDLPGEAVKKGLEQIRQAVASRP